MDKVKAPHISESPAKGKNTVINKTDSGLTNANSHRNGRTNTSGLGGGSSEKTK